MRNNVMSSRFAVVGVLAVVGLFAVSEAKGVSGKRWIHPLCKPLETTKNGPFVQLDGGDLMVVDGKVLKTSKDDGKTWSPDGGEITSGMKLNHAVSHNILEFSARVLDTLASVRCL